MWARRSHLIHPLTVLTSNKVKFKRTDVEKKYFDDIKFAITHDTLLAYPDFNKRFDIHTDDSYYQLGAVVSHGGRPIAFYGCKLTGP